MNLELLDPFRRQIPDRVDATLSLPSSFHQLKSAAAAAADHDEKSTSEKEESPEDQEWKAAYHVAFNRRGTYLGVGHASGTVAVHDFLSRTLSALYRPEEQPDSKESSTAALYPNGVTSVSWSRRSRTLLAGALGDDHVRLIDTTHPFGPEECVSMPLEADPNVEEASETTLAGVVGVVGNTPMVVDAAKTCEFMKTARALDTLDLSAKPGNANASRRFQEHQAALQQHEPKSLPQRYPIISFSFPHAVGGSLQIHPRDNMAGLAVLSNGSLVLWVAPSDGWESFQELETTPMVKVMTLWEGTTNNLSITCAAFDPHGGEKVYAATKNGILVGFNISKTLEELKEKLSVSAPDVQQPSFQYPIPGGATVWHLLVSRNGRHLLLNCADSALRVYNAEECFNDTADDVRPKVFQDVVSKVPFASCDFSGDAEYLVGGCNGTDKYDLYLWNATTGALMDRLTGPQVSLHSVAWHPTRSFLAVATSDGVVDIWGPRMDWTAFAPGFQALPMNVEYVEEEDEFDIVDKPTEQVQEEEDVTVDVVTVEPVPVFASDSESESEVFSFETKVANIMAGRGRNSAAVGWAGRTAAEEKD